MATAVYTNALNVKKSDGSGYEPIIISTTNFEAAKQDVNNYLSQAQVARNEAISAASVAQTALSSIQNATSGSGITMTSDGVIGVNIGSGLSLNSNNQLTVPNYTILKSGIISPPSDTTNTEKYLRADGSWVSIDLSNQSSIVNLDTVTGTSDKYDSTIAYNVGDYCIYDDCLWEKINIAEIGVAPAENYNWSKITLKSLQQTIDQHNIQLQLVWQNSNFSSTLAAGSGTITSSASLYLITCAYGASGNALIGPINTHFYLYGTDQQESTSHTLQILSGSKIATRRITIDNTNLSFSYTSGYLGSTASNIYCIPMQIYGIHGFNFM